MMKHRANSMSTAASTSALNPEDVWFVDFGASNHMTSHKEWFHELREPERPGYVETGDNTTHPIRHIGNVPFGKEGKQTYINNVLHVPTITKNLVSIGQIVEQGMQVRFDQGGCFIEKEGRIITRGRREGRMFILDSHEMTSAMFAKSTTGLATSISTNSKRCNRKESSSASRHSKRRRLKAYAKCANSASNTDTRSRKSGT